MRFLFNLTQPFSIVHTYWGIMSENTINIRLLIEGCRNENRASQRKLYEHFYGYGMSISLRYTQNNIEAEEILNDTFLKVFQNIDKYDANYPFKVWLRKILVNTAIDYFRKFQKHRLTFASDLISDQVDVSTVTAIDPTDDVLPIVQQLSPKYRMVFNLYVMEGYKHHEIAEKLQISVGTSKSNLARAKEKLRELWQNNNPERVKMNDA